MDKTDAEWRAHMRNGEREEWDAAKADRDQAAERFRALDKRLKARCYARMMREARRAKD